MLARHFPFALGLTALLVTFSSAVAAPQFGGGEVDPFSSDAPSKADIQFDGGNLAEYADVLKDAFPRFNLIVTDSVADRMIPPLKLKNIDAHSAIAVLRSLDPRLEVEPVGNRGKAEVMILKHRLSDDADSEIEIISIQALLESVPLEHLMSAIEGTMDLVDGESRTQPVLHVHDKTGLLMVKAHPRDLDVIHRIVEQLRAGKESVEAERQMREEERLSRREEEFQQHARNMRREREEQELMLNQLRVELTQREIRIAELEGRLVESENRHEQLRAEIEKRERSRDRDGGDR